MTPALDDSAAKMEFLGGEGGERESCGDTAGGAAGRGVFGGVSS